MTSKNKKSRTPVKASSFSEFEWTYYIIFLVECDDVSNNFISALNETEISDKRIRVIRKQEILNNLKQKSKPTTPNSTTPSSKGKSPKKQEVSDEKEKLEHDEQTILNLLKGNKDHYLNLPPNSLANVVKKFINKLKVSYFENKTLGGGKVNATSKKSKKTADSSKESKKTSSSQKGGSSEKGKKKQIMVSYHVEENRQLPKCLIFTGFYESLLPAEMVKLGLPVRAVVALKKRTISSSENVLPVLLEREADNFGLPLLSKKFNFDFFKFWSYACHSADDFTKVKSEVIADIDLELPDQIAGVFETPIRGKNLPANTKKELKFNINKVLTNLTTHILNSIDNYNQYVNSTETYDLEAKYMPLSEAKHYLYLSSMLPNECSDVSFVLYNMVDQVSVWNNEKIEKQSKNVGKKLINSKKIINHNDKLDLKTFHLCTNLMSYDIHSILENYLSTNPLFISWKGNKISKKQEELNKFHMRRLFKLGGNIDQYIFDLHLHWYILCRMKLEKKSSKFKTSKKTQTQGDSYLNRGKLFRDSIVIKKEMIKPKLKVEKWRRFSSMSVKHVQELRKANLKTLKKFIEISDIVELVKKDKIVEKLASKKFDSDFKYTEYLSPFCLLQTIQELTSSFIKCDKLHFKPSNKIVVWFHNDIGLTSEKDYFRVDTLLGFRDFYKNNMRADSIHVANLSDNIGEFSSNDLKFQGNSDDRLEMTDNQIDLNGTEKRETSKIKVCNLWGLETELENKTHKFVSNDSSSVVLEIDHWLNMRKSMKITIEKRNTELIYHKDMLQTHNEEKNSSIYSNAVLNLPNNTRVSVDIEEKYLPERFLKLFFNFSIVLPSGLSIEVVKNNGDYYVKQKYVFQSTLTESIKNEKYRCYLKTGQVMIFFRNGKIRILDCNGTIVDCKGIVDSTPQPSEVGKSSTEESNQENISKKEEKGGKKNKERNKKHEKKEFVDEKGGKNEDDKKTQQKSRNSSKKSSDKKQKREKEIDEKATQESEMLESKKQNFFSVSKQFITTAYGERSIIENGIKRTRKSCSLRTIFQPYQTLYIDRSDGYKALFTDDGGLLSTFADGTRIFTIPDSLNHSTSDLDWSSSSLIGVYCQESTEFGLKNILDEDFTDKEESFTIINLKTLAEHPLYARVEFNVEKCAIKMTLPGGTIVYVLENLNDFIIDVDTITTVIFSKENIVFSCGLLDTTEKENITVINCVSKTIGLSKQAQKPPIFCKTIDSFGRTFLINNDGEVELNHTPTSDDSLEKVTRNSQHLGRGYYHQKNIPRNQFERFFVVNPDFSGHEFIHKYDINLLSGNKNNLNKHENAYYNTAAFVTLTNNPTCGELKSKTIQYPLFENYFQRYRTSYSDLEYHYFPDNFLRSALSKRWTYNDSFWLFKGNAPDNKSVQKSNATKREDKPLAVVYRTLNEICHDNNNKLKNIATVILSYEERNNKLFCRYSRKRFKRRELLNKFLGDKVENAE